MHTCSEGHDEIAYEGSYNNCPMCNMIKDFEDDIETLNEKIKSLEEDNDSLKDRIDDLIIEIQELESEDNTNHEN